MQPVAASRRLYLGLGSNLGDRFGQLVLAIQSIQKKGLSVRKLSPIYETEPVGERDQPAFLNLVVEVDSGLSPAEVVAAGLATEAEMGRIRGRPGGPRTLDVDLLLDGQTVLHEDGVTVPHPRLHERRFVLVPLAELAPDLRHPVLGRTIKELLAECPDRSRVDRWQGSFLVPGAGTAV
jgi:2-amino-4-hydroxy-6-hydroxymethyldihydropteridine diphosphokinase